MSLQDPSCAHGVLGTPHGKVRDNLGGKILFDVRPMLMGMPLFFPTSILGLYNIKEV